MTPPPLPQHLCYICSNEIIPNSQCTNVRCILDCESRTLHYTHSLCMEWVQFNEGVVFDDEVPNEEQQPEADVLAE